MSNADSWTKENGKMKVSGDCTVLHLSRMSSILLFIKIFCQSLTKTWYSTKKHAENVKTFQIEKKHEKHAELHACVNVMLTNIYRDGKAKAFASKICIGC